MLATAAFPASGAAASLVVQMVFWRLARKAPPALGASSACSGARCRQHVSPSASLLQIVLISKLTSTGS